MMRLRLRDGVFFPRRANGEAVLEIESLGASKWVHIEARCVSIHTDTTSSPAKG